MSSLNSSRKNLKGAPPKLNPKKSASFDERILDLESAFLATTEMLKKVQGALNQQNQRLALVEGYASALVQITGYPTVDAKIAEMRRDAMETQAAAMSTRLQESIDQGKMVQVDAIQPDKEQLLALRCYTSEGVIKTPSTIYSGLFELDPKLTEILKDKKVGDTFEFEGDKTEVLAVYQDAPRAPVAEASALPSEEVSDLISSDAQEPA